MARLEVQRQLGSHGSTRSCSLAFSSPRLDAVCMYIQGICVPTYIEAEHICMHTYIHVYIHTISYTHVYLFPFMYGYMCTSVYMCICTHLYTYAYMHIHVRIMTGQPVLRTVYKRHDNHSVMAQQGILAVSGHVMSCQLNSVGSWGLCPDCRELLWFIVRSYEGGLEVEGPIM